MTERKKLNATGTMMDVLMEMSEGNPGAISVLAQLLEGNPMDGFTSILALDDMNMRGSQIWVGYKDYCGQDIDKFRAAIKSRDQMMVDTVNEHQGTGTEEQACTRGASFQHR